MTKKLIWRLGKLPDSYELCELIKNKVITNEEAKEILLSSEDEVDRDKKSLESEIKFLRELVEKLSNGRGEIVETIKYIEKPYYHYPWWSGYSNWCGGNITTGTASATTTGANCLSGSYIASNLTDTNFTSINTF
jgi:hypothetical protein